MPPRHRPPCRRPTPGSPAPAGRLRQPAGRGAAVPRPGAAGPRAAPRAWPRARVRRPCSSAPAPTTTTISAAAWMRRPCGWTGRTARLTDRLIFWRDPPPPGVHGRPGARGAAPAGECGAGARIDRGRHAHRPAGPEPGPGPAQPPLRSLSPAAAQRPPSRPAPSHRPFAPGPLRRIVNDPATPVRRMSRDPDMPFPPGCRGRPGPRSLSIGRGLAPASHPPVPVPAP
jgi:hypothetical protein